MTFDQTALLVLLLALICVFALDRFRVEIVAVCGLTAAAVLGLVRPDDLFTGLISPAVLTVAEILIITRTVADSQLIDAAARRVTAIARGERQVLAALTVIAAFVSVFMNNVGALALMLPLAHSIARTTQIPPGRLLMPLSFATLLGGLCSTIGTPANLIVSDARAAAGLPGFALFDFAHVGIPATLVGIAWLVIAAPRLLAGRGLTVLRPEVSGPRRLVTEVTVPESSPFVGKSLDDVDAEIGGRVHSMLRNERHLFTRREQRRLAAGDLLLLEADAHAIMAVANNGALALEPARPDIEPTDSDWTEAVVLPQSTIVGSTVGLIEDFHANGVSVIAVSPQRNRVEGRLSDMQLAIGDVLLLRGRPDALSQAIEDCDCLALSPRGLEPPNQGAIVALFLFMVAIAVTATGVVAPHIAFGAVVAMLAVTGVIQLRRAVAGLDWSILIMLAAMIPLGVAVETTGTASLIAEAITHALAGAGPVTLAAAMLMLAAAITPFVNNASTAILLAPIAVGVARVAGLDPSPLLIAVAVGASLDFLTPFGHHNNTIVMGIGGYRFRDFARLGAGLLAVSAAAALTAITWWWF